MASSEKEQFHQLLQNSQYLTILTGAGVSAESGIPTFRGEGSRWRNFQAPELSSIDTWHRDPGLLWEFFNYRREVVEDKKPNPAHYAIAQMEQKFTEAGRSFSLITQNIDDLHLVAGSKQITRMHGSLWLVRCVDCHKITENHDVPITPAFTGSGSPDPQTKTQEFTTVDLPKCKSCNGILRPHVVWFGEALDPKDMENCQVASCKCDVFIVVGTSAIVYPAAGLSQIAKQFGAKVVIINLEPTPADFLSDFLFQGKAGEILPGLFAFDLTKS